MSLIDPLPTVTSDRYVAIEIAPSAVNMLRNLTRIPT